MGKPNRIVALRLPPDLAERLGKLQAAFDLPPSTVLRFLIASQLERPIDEQIEVITSQIVKPHKNSGKCLTRIQLDAASRNKV